MFLLAQNMGKQVQHFFDWWFYELGQLIPQGLKKCFYTPQPQLFIRIHNFQVFMSYFEQDAEKPLLAVYQHKEGIQQLVDFFKKHPEWQRATKIVLLNAKQLLKTRLDLPLAAQANLNQVIGYELDRYTPFSAAQCYFVAQVLGKNATGNRLNVALLFISKLKLLHHCKALTEMGLSADIIAHASDVERFRANAYKPPYNFLPTQYRNQRQDLRQLKRFMAICFLVLTSIAAGLPFWSQQNRLNTLQQQVSIAKKQAHEVEAIKAETTGLLKAEQQIVALKQQAPVILNVIEQLSKLLPKDTWLSSFEYQEGKFVLQGLSASASGLINLLEDSHLFKQTMLVSPVTRDAQQALDQFQLETTLESANDVQ